MGKSNRASEEHPPSRGRVPGIEAIISLARKVTAASDAPVVGGIATLLHGGGRTTRDIDIYSADFWETHRRLEKAGILWDSERREHLIDGVAVHMVGDDSLGGPPKRVSVIEGVIVIGLADHIRGKMTVGLDNINRSKDIADVLELIRVVPLKKDFAAKLPTKLRSAFKKLVDEVHEPRRTPGLSTLKFWERYGTNVEVRRRARRFAKGA